MARVKLPTSRKALAAEQGLRPLTAAEKRKLGLPTSNRDYTSQKLGVKRLAPSKVVSRRRAEEPALGKSFEKAAKESRARGGGRVHMDPYTRALRAYAERHNRRPGDVRKDPAFKKLYREAYKRAHTDSRTTAERRPVEPSRKIRAQSRRRLRALYDLGVFEHDEFLELYERYEEIAG